LVDRGFVERHSETMMWIPVFIVLSFIARGVTSFIGEYTIEWIGRRVTTDIRNMTFAHMLRLPCGYFDVVGPGTIVSKLIFNIEQISNATTTALIAIVGGGLTAVALFGYILYVNWKLTMIILVVAPISMFLVREMSKGFRRRSRQIQDSIREVSRIASQATSGYRVVKAFGGAPRETKVFEQANERNRRHVLRKKALAIGGTALVQIVSSFGLALMMYVALNKMKLSPGDFVAYLVALMLLAAPLRKLSRINETIQSGLAAASTTFNLLDEPGELDDGTVTLPRAQGRVEYRDVSFRYKTSTETVLSNVSFLIEPGQTYALVGASGGGKTTVAALLSRFYRVESGAILLDDIDINEYKLDNLRAQISIVGQDTLLFDDTLAANIAYGSTTEIDLARVEAAARTAHVLEFAQRLPQGLDTRVGERGSLLSGGQRQRVAIARALYKDAPILILDEATSALDLESERLVQDAMGQLQANRTTLVIAHRLSTIEQADRILVMSQGRVVESGKHAELLAQGGAYARLYRSQFSSAD
jgi:subfamily B ATP-binding cassette protein MsbA